MSKYSDLLGNLDEKFPQTVDKNERIRRLKASNVVEHIKDELKKTKDGESEIISEVISNETLSNQEKDILRARATGSLKARLRESLLKNHIDYSSDKEVLNVLEEIVCSIYISTSSKLKIINSVLFDIGQESGRYGYYIGKVYRSYGENKQKINTTEAFSAIMSSILVPENTKMDVMYSLNEFNEKGYVLPKFSSLEQVKDLIVEVKERLNGKEDN